MKNQLTPQEKLQKLTDIIKWTLGIIVLITLITISTKSKANNVNIEKPQAILPTASDYSKDTDEDIKGVYSDYRLIVWHVKSNEELRLKAYWDVSRYSIGWGTKSVKGGECSLFRANRDFKSGFDERYKSLETRYPYIDRWTRLVLTALTYNVGTFGDKLDTAIKSNDIDAIARCISMYNKSFNKKTEKLEVNPVLVNRRKKDVALLYMSHDQKQKAAHILGKKVANMITNKTS